MEHAQRTSPIADALHELRPNWGMLNDMPVAQSVGRDGGAPVMLCDLSALRRYGVKGPQAAAWLEAHGVKPPVGINQWSALAGDGVVCRLTSSEFLVEDGWQGNTARSLAAQYQYGTAGVYPVLRQDCEVGLAGERAGELLVQICSFSFRALKEGGAEVVMTSMAGVGVIVVRQPYASGALYRIWCDGTYAPYLWETLLGIAEELGGRALGIGDMFPGSGKA